ncbi:Bor family protein [Cecembia calidifontis]|uniref:Bor protein n=1 Tax=Cecembia calidifontis TaxID=1187080 RepID=A0A4Q7PBZ3_9BACT|nr:Bor family protein [Cecembia calidifontis]RZS97791.1 Bor protein [Cecembia calidifontis]
MKKIIIKSTLIFALAGSLTSCYTQSYIVGNGPQRGVETTEKSHYLVYGLAPLKTADPVKMAGDAQDYSVTIQHSFIDGVLNALTFGIYTPTTTKVVK